MKLAVGDGPPVANSLGQSPARLLGQQYAAPKLGGADQ